MNLKAFEAVDGAGGLNFEEIQGGGSASFCGESGAPPSRPASQATLPQVGGQSLGSFQHTLIAPLGAV